jgi:nucleoside-diphosphate-sugar epimerase
MESNKFEVLVAGAGGHLGNYIVKELLKYPNVVVSVLDMSIQHCEECNFDKNKLGRVIKADVNKPESLKNNLKGFHTIISAINGDEQTIFNGQMALLEEGKISGVKRFIPSEFNVDLKNLGQSEDPLLTYRMRFRDELKKSGLNSLVINVGLFYDTFLSLSSEGICYFGENFNQKMDMISATDAAKFIAEVASDPNRSGEFKFAAEQISPSEIQEILQKVFGNTLTVKKAGSFDDLRKKAAQLKQEGKVKEATNHLFALHAFDGSGKFSDINNNMFNNISPIHLEDYLKLNKDKLHLTGST